MKFVTLVSLFAGKFVPSHKVHPLTFKNRSKLRTNISRQKWSGLLHNRVNNFIIIKCHDC